MPAHEKLTDKPPKYGPVIFTLRGNTMTAPAGKTLDKTVTLLGLQPLAYLAVRGDEMLTADEILKPGDQIRLVAVVSGG
jgi:sulfur carrier protein ThiS